VQAAKHQIEPYLQPGMWIEDKETTLSVHYRQADVPDDIARKLTPQIVQIAADHGLRFFEGRRIFEIRPPIDVNKGTAFRHLVAEYRLDAAIYIGDDVTDTDAFRAARALRESGECYALGVGVESDVTPELVTETSDLSASGVSGVESLLAWLLSACKESST
jgi:trehalose 6-phosphate phosphatase